MKTWQNRRFIMIGDFTLIELLLVVAIIAILISMLMPTLKNARGMAKTIGCQNNQKNLGVGHFGYQNDWDGYLVPHYESYWWENVIAPYAGMRNGYIKPYILPGSVFTCPEQPKGNGHYPSFGRNNECGRPAAAWNVIPRRITDFTRPSTKFFTADAVSDLVMIGMFFLPYSYDSANGRLQLRHVGGRCNISFLDGHIKAYGAPPIPKVSNHAEGCKWMVPGYAPPAGL